MSKPVKVVIKKSSKPEKKLMAVFTMSNGREKTTHFGQERRRLYLERHRRNENWNNPVSAGALSRWILWNKETRAASITAYKKRFNLK